MAITINFKGICTHLPPTGDAHRVVLVRADNGAYINESKIPPHIPKMRIKAADIVSTDGDRDGLVALDAETWRLCGVKLSLDGWKEPFSRAESTSFPKLRATNDDTLTLSETVAFNEEAACYFDLVGGKLTSGETEHGAIYGIVTVETNEDPILQVFCWWNRKTTSIHLTPNATIDIEHVGVADGDSEMDFLLHYRVFDWVPANAFVPTEEKKSALKKAPGNISVGCSNSQYP